MRNNRIPRREAKAALVGRTGRIAAVLERLYPNAKISLDFTTPWECLVATILSSQCTDERVNQVTPGLFSAFPDIHAVAAAPLNEIERLIVKTGFFRQKARSIQGCATRLVERFGGAVARNLADLVTLPGIGRKTANVILGHVWGQPAMVVDTHVRRLSRRLALTRNTNPDKIESDLHELLDAQRWTAFSMRLILHGRRVCYARRPRCTECSLLPDCPQVGVKPELRGRPRTRRANEVVS